MTISPDARPLAFETLDDAIRALRGSGLRLSSARRIVLEALFAAQGPASAAHLAQGLAIDESSVYRNLEVFEAHGLVRHVHLGHSPGLYTLVGGDELEYLYCERCAKVSAVLPSALDALRVGIREQFGLAARFTHFAIVGVCEHCAVRQSQPGETHQQLHSHGDHVHAHPHTHHESGESGESGESR